MNGEEKRCLETHPILGTRTKPASVFPLLSGGEAPEMPVVEPCLRHLEGGGEDSRSETFLDSLASQSIYLISRMGRKSGLALSAE